MKTSFKVLRSLTVLLLLIFITSGCTDETSYRDSDNKSRNSELSKNESNLHFNTSLKGKNEVPDNDSKGTGQVTVKITKDESKIHYKITTGNIENVFAAHFHLAPAGSNGGIVATLFSNPNQPSGRNNGVLAEGYITATDVTGAISGDLNALISALRMGNIYVNVHTISIPSGELRGQL